MLIYTLKTTYNYQYNFIISWKKWEFNEEFTEFTHNDGKVTVIKTNDILSLTQN